LTESEPSNNEAVDVDTLAATTLAIAKSASPDPVVPGQTVIYTIQVSNTGAVNATNLTVTDPLPSGLTFASASGGGWTCNEVSGVVTCTRALLVPGDAPPIVIAARVGVSPGLVTNTASVSGGNAGAAQASVGTAVVAAPKIPTLSGVGMMAFALILAGIAALIMRQF
jgi:uncharacterized repeat protein (TIGR01451 family)